MLSAPRTVSGLTCSAGGSLSGSRGVSPRLTRRDFYAGDVNDPSSRPPGSSVLPKLLTGIAAVTAVLGTLLAVLNGLDGRWTSMTAYLVGGAVIASFCLWAARQERSSSSHPGSR